MDTDPKRVAPAIERVEGGHAERARDEIVDALGVA
jgi:hypothetical protein